MGGDLGFIGKFHYVFRYCSCIFRLYVFKFRIIKYRKLLQTGTTGLTRDHIQNLLLEELKRAMDGFKEELGKGAFGAVYKRNFDNGKNLVVVKRLEKVVDEGEREFRAEMRVIGATRVDWNLRVSIALDVARGILYLHEECEAPIVHYDIKPQNILLDELLTAKISYVGLAKLLMPDQTRTFTGVRGIRGYLASEWQTDAPVSVKVDVYSYGICLVESGLDKLVGSEVDIKTLEGMISVAIWCIQDEPALRPPMQKSICFPTKTDTFQGPPSCNNGDIYVIESFDLKAKN
ncbi:hypothetical protein HAX54_040145 [Datura stramonium]|uniref:Protein kinase domain-containing protein n=1 Tax=Datura stramonium TaxID=4076 RepID=A0ABS8VNK1_DATST|nr:hypothetical protein [Datura stramonium]